MKLLKQDENQQQFELMEGEANVLLAILNSYPLTKLKTVKMSKGCHGAEALDREFLLNESLKTHRNELKKVAVKLAKENLGRSKEAWLLTLKPDHKEILLQILNDVRTGIWKELGEPEDIHQKPDSPRKQQQWTIMNLAGYFEEYLVSLT
jgi:hypothetical protein